MSLDELVNIAEKVYAKDDSNRRIDGSLDLFKKHVSAMRNLQQAGRIHQTEPVLSEIEILSIVILEGFGSSQFIQGAAFDSNKSTALTSALISSLDSALLKIPKCQHQLLYANDGFERYKNKVGDIFTVQGYLTTSTDDYDNAHSIKWVVTPLAPNCTRAHEIYRVYNHGDDCPYPENQVEFRRATPFEITKIEEGDSYDTVYIRELPL